MISDLRFAFRQITRFPGCTLVVVLTLAFVLSRVLYGLHVFDPVAYPLICLVLMATAALACWLPARRATKVDPMVALRSE